MADIQRLRNLTDDSSLGSFKNEVIIYFFLCYILKEFINFSLVFNLGVRKQ